MNQSSTTPSNNKNMFTRNYLVTVKDLYEYISSLLKEDFKEKIWVRGEVSEVKKYNIYNFVLILHKPTISFIWIY